MKRKTSPQQVRERMNGFRRSAELQRLAEEAPMLVARVRKDRRKVIPVAEVARMLDVSVRQLWLWIGRGWIDKPVQKPPRGSLEEGKRPAARRQGLMPGRLASFLKLLQQVKMEVGWERQKVRRGRPARAEEKMRQAYRDFTLKTGMSPVELARVIGVSPSTVRRLMHRGVVPHRRRTLCRYALEGSSLAPRPRTQVSGKRKKKLTRFRALWPLN